MTRTWQAFPWEPLITTTQVKEGLKKPLMSLPCLTLL